MKKRLSTLLILAMLISLIATFSACGEDSSTKTTAVNASTDIQTKYDNAIKDLNTLIKNSTYTINYESKNDNREAARLYNEFKELGNYKDSAKYLSKFEVRPNVLVEITKTTVDNLGNKHSSSEKIYRCDNKGNIIDTDIILDFFSETLDYYYIATYSDFDFKYDAKGTLTQIRIYSGSHTEGIITPTYDDNGNIVEARILTTDSDHTNKYTYDNHNRLISAEKHSRRGPSTYTYGYNKSGLLTEIVQSWSWSWGSDQKDITKYLYDENGRIILETKQGDGGYGYEKTYEYDAKGNLIKVTEDHTNNPLKEITYELDESGNPISGEMIETDSCGSIRSTLSFHYETLYFYIDA